MKGIFISCEEANHNCDKSQYHEAGIWDKVRLSFHLIFCRACRKYSSNNSKLTKLVHKEGVDCMEAHEKKKLRNAFGEELKKYN